jgi:ABC-type protease/lipase transport system fused ATPase/permease subunit
VADIVGLKPFIENLEDGLNTNIGNAGSYLSGGQRQRIALARALYNNPKIIILDEPSSNLDREGDHALIKALSILKSKGSSIILIAHQTHLIELADQVLVLIDGQNKMYGPKDEVIAALQGKPSSSNK